MSIEDKFEAANDDFLKFDRVANKRSQRPDLHAWLLLDELFPAPGRGMVASASHDEIWLEPDGKQLETLTDEHVLELTRCGVRYDSEYECLAMFV